MEQADLLKEVASWPIEARDDNNLRYFYEIDEIAPLLNGTRNFVIGRKGTGKTAIAEHIASLNDPLTFVVTLSFKSFPWNRLYEMEDSTYTAPNQYISAWKVAILSALLRLYTKSDACDLKVRKVIDATFPNEIDRELRSGLAKILERGVGISAAGFGGSVAKADRLKNGNISDLVDGLEQFAFEHRMPGRYYIIFDELDEDYKDVLTRPDHRSRFFQLLTSLFKAAQDTRFLSTESDFSIVPIVLLRSDIYDLLRDPDKNKWRDRTVDLNWSPAMLRRLLTYRISKAIDANSAVLPFEDAWSALFSVETAKYGKNNKRETGAFNYIVSSTYLRPRDIISYVRECARVALENGVDRIGDRELKAANERHSLYMRRELVDEMHSVVDDADNILDILSEMHKTVVRYDNLLERMETYVSSNERTDGLTAVKIIDILFYFSVIGNIDGNGNKRFSYDGPHVVLRRDASVCVHRSLLKGLQMF